MKPATINTTAFGTLQVFSDVDAIVQHLNAHVLSAPEANGWRLIASAYDAEVGPDDQDRFRFAQAMLRSAGSGLGLYRNVYVDQIEKACSDAAKHGWSMVKNGVSVGVGLTGVVVLAKERSGTKVVVSSFIAGVGDASRVGEDDRSRCLEKALCRESPAGPLPRNDGRFSANAELARAKREAKRSREERIYFDLFRKAEKFVRSRSYIPSDRSNEARNEVALLLGPIRESLKTAGEASQNEPGVSAKNRNFRAWLHLWQEARGGGV